MQEQHTTVKGSYVANAVGQATEEKGELRKDQSIHQGVLCLEGQLVPHLPPLAADMGQGTVPYRVAQPSLGKDCLPISGTSARND